MLAALCLPGAAQEPPPPPRDTTIPVTEPDVKSQVEQTEMQPLFGAQLPKAGRWQPLSQRERWRLFVKQDFASPVTVVHPIIPVVLTFAKRSPQEWPRTGIGAAQRYGANWVGTLAADFTRTTVAMALHQEVRYIACPCSGGRRRVWNALRQVVQTYDDKGQWTFAPGRVAANYTSAAVVVYGIYPQGASPFREFLNNGTSQFYYTALGNLSREFLPDLVRLIRKKKKHHTQP